MICMDSKITKIIFFTIDCEKLIIASFISRLALLAEKYQEIHFILIRLNHFYEQVK